MGFLQHILFFVPAILAAIIFILFAIYTRESYYFGFFEQFNFPIMIIVCLVILGFLGTLLEPQKEVPSYACIALKNNTIEFGELLKITIDNSGK